ncbi:class I SAM-dependent methyltransferase [Mucilaginibacter terrae]|uniref:Ubiquinone/menaquinone biosynthesis C-methylase UbiE n=1 Tax=Mucilaginibacter terrae TaxID=1955052 RepID=A0ABU3GUZ0_9SPHI|nr:class I SAM-dependent methyltransferase [Mucilaginibacter terrae]MDT3402455.1 ubiquinone/menaquinone biosynthesis C-methylase UbiE [Mucilaginibacter terrae]
MKDNFSTQSDHYAKYRPTYPPELFDYLLSITPSHQTAWDCGTGNGQVAFELAKRFEQVYATDVSQAQIDNASQANNITYSVQPAEQTNFDNNFFDLIVVAQAIHWFDFEKFYNEVRRTVKANALLCVTGYGMIQVSAEVDAVIDHFYRNVIDSYWDAERKYVDENYQTIPFPFEEIEAPEFANVLEWNSEHLMGYLNTWSAVKHFIKQNGYNPVDELKLEIEKHWGNDDFKRVKFPVLLRIGKV